MQKITEKTGFEPNFRTGLQWVQICEEYDL